MIQILIQIALSAAQVEKQHRITIIKYSSLLIGIFISDVFDDLSPLVQNGLLLLLFILQHSVLKHLKYELNLSPAKHRLLYIFTTTATLHVSCLKSTMQ